MNGIYIRSLTVEDLTARLEAFTGRAGLDELARISQEKIHTLADFWPLAGSLIDGPVDDPPARERWLGPDGRAALADAREALAAGGSFDQDAVERALSGVIERRGDKPRQVYQPLRVAISGSTISPGMFESLAFLGRQEALRRIDLALGTTST
jgi:glutamyl-tRNA synthetase